MGNKRQQIFSWQQQGLIEDSKIEQALETTNANHSPKQWFDFIEKSLLWLSIISVAFGVIFFFAYNWKELSTLQKFGLIQGLIIVSTIIYTQTKSQSSANTAVLFFLAILIGALFALFGQTYQTGKDPWQLFILWTLFITPLALVSKNSSLWLLWLGLANLTLTLIFDARFGWFGILFRNERIMLLYAFLNLIAAVGFEFLYYSKFKLISNRIAAKVAIIATMITFSWVAVYSIFEVFGTTYKGWDLIFYIVWMVVVYYFYRIKTLDILVLSSWVVSGIIFILALLGRVINSDYNGLTFLLFGLTIIGLSTVGIKWLMKLLNDENNKGENV